MLDVKIVASSGWELVHSVTVLLDSSKVTVTYEGLAMDIVFKHDNTGEVRYDGNQKDSRWILELLNFTNAFGEGKLEPIPFAVSDGRDVNISFFVQTLNVETFNRVLTLNFYKEPVGL